VNKKNKVITAVTASAVLVAGTIGAIAIFGYTSDPEYASLEKGADQSIGGTIAYVVSSDRGTCIHTVPAGGGEPKQLACSDATISEIVFTPDGKLITGSTDYSMMGSDRSMVVYDPVSGKELERFQSSAYADTLVEKSGGTELYTSDEYFNYSSDPFFGGEDGAHTVWIARDPDGEDRVIWREAPGDYDFYSAMYSPDRKWILVEDSNGDLLIGDDRNDLRKLVSISDDSDDGYYYFGYGSDTKAWYQPGETKGTVTIDALKQQRTSPTTAMPFDDRVSITPMLL
jgi:hypothetical protein